MDKPLDLAQFEGPNWPLSERHALLAECKRQREQIARLVEALHEIEGHAANGGKGIITNLANVRRVVRALLRELGEDA